jgi:hypothetical protein
MEDSGLDVDRGGAAFAEVGGAEEREPHHRGQEEGDTENTEAKAADSTLCVLCALWDWRFLPAPWIL